MSFPSLETVAAQACMGSMGLSTFNCPTGIMSLLIVDRCRVFFGLRSAFVLGMNKVNRGAVRGSSEIKHGAVACNVLHRHDDGLRRLLSVSLNTEWDGSWCVCKKVLDKVQN